MWFFNPALHEKWQIQRLFSSVFSCIQSKYRKIRTRKISLIGHFSRSAVSNFVNLSSWNFQFEYTWTFQRFLTYETKHWQAYSFLCRSSHQTCSIRKGILGNFAKFTRNHLWQSLFLEKVVGFRLWYRCFPMNFAKFLKTPFL